MAADLTPAPRAINVTRSTALAERLELGESLWARFMGLMGRPGLPPGDGLWLSGTNGIHMFFMRFAIDAVFLGRAAAEGTRTVLSVHRAVRPWLGIIPLVRGADGVLELPVGTIESTGTQVGDLVRFA